MTLRVKFLSGILLILFASLLCLGYGVYSGILILDNVNIAENDAFPSLQKANELTEKVRQTHHAITQALNGDEDFAEQLEEAKGEFFKILDELNLKLNDPELLIIRELYAQYVDDGLKYGNKVLKNPDSLDGLQDIARASQNVTNKIESYQVQKASDFRSAMGDINYWVNWFYRLFPIAGGVLLILVVSLAILITTFLRSLNALERNASELGKGNLDHKVLINRKDELGVMQSTFEAMRQTLREHIENLDGLVKEKTKALVLSQKEMEDILMSMEQGIFTFNKDLTLNDKHSKNAELYFNRNSFADLKVKDALKLNDSEDGNFQKWIQLMERPSTLGKWARFEKLCPVLEVKNLDANGEEQILKLSYRPIVSNNKLDKIMTLASDITEQRRAEKQLEVQRKERELQMQRVIAWVSNEYENIHQFNEELISLSHQLLQLKTINSLVESIPQTFRQVHTIRGNSGTFGLSLLSEIMMPMEQALQDLQNHPDHTESFEKWTVALKELEGEIQELSKTRDLIFQKKQGQMSIDSETYHSLVQKIKEGEASDIKNIYKELYMLNSENFGFYCQRYQNLLNNLEGKLEKPFAPLAIRNPSVRIPRDMMRVFEEALVHLIRNAADHGIENTEERERKGKSVGTIEMSCKVENNNYSIQIKDDGAGINTEKITQSAISKGVITEEQAKTMNETDKCNLIFIAGMSSKDDVSEISGRGIGMDAVKNNLERYGGAIQLQNFPG